MDAPRLVSTAETPSARTAVPTPANAPSLGGGRSSTPAESRPHERSLAVRLSGIVVGMLALAAIGVWSNAAGAGVPVPIPPRPSADAHGAWAQSAPGSATAPARAAPPSNAPPAPEPPAPAGGGGVTNDGKVVLNLATAEELRKLPRVGQKRADAIVELRKRLGKFRKPTDLLRVRGIGPKTLRLMLPKLVVDPEPAHPAG